MAIIKPKTRKKRDGSLSYTIQVPAKLRGATGMVTTTFSTNYEAYAFAIELENRENVVSIQRVASKNPHSEWTVDELTDWYQTTQEYLTIKKKSKDFYLIQIKSACESRHLVNGSRFGNMPLTQVTKKTVREIINHFATTGSGHKAYHLVKVMRLIWNVGIRDEIIEINPWEKARVAKPPKRKVYWTEPELRQFVEYADETYNYSFGTLALLCFILCQRPGDMRQLRWNNLRDGSLYFIQEKTGADCAPKVPPQLVERLEHHKAVHEVAKRLRPADECSFIVLHDRILKPFDAFYYHEARKLMDEVGLRPELRFGDFRRSGATFLADNDATEDQLLAVTGHTTRAGLEPYLHRSKKRADQVLGEIYGKAS